MPPLRRGMSQVVISLFIFGEADYLASVVNSVDEARRESRQRAKIDHDAVLPEEAMVEYLAGSLD
jgi:hypothetical protein